MGKCSPGRGETSEGFMSKEKFRRYVLPFILIWAWDFFIWIGTMLLQKNGWIIKAHMMGWTIDEKIPLWSPAVYVYVGCFVFFAVNYFLAFWQEEKEAKRFFWACFLAEGISGIIFLTYPTTMAEPVVAGNAFSDKLLLFVYSCDQRANLFPSFHVLFSWFSCLAVTKNPKISKGYKIFSWVFFVMICISTLLTKQHVIVDIFGGIFMAEGCYLLVGYFMKKENKASK